MPRTIEGEALIRLPSMNNRIFPPRRMTLCKKGSSVYLLEYRSAFVGQVVDFTRFEARESVDILLEDVPKRIKLENGGELEEMSVDLSAPIQRVKACIRIRKNSNAVEVKTEIEDMDVEPVTVQSHSSSVRNSVGEVNKGKIFVGGGDEEELFDNENKDTVVYPALTVRSAMESRYRRMREVRAAPRCRNRRGRRRKANHRGIKRNLKLVKFHGDSDQTAVQTNEEMYTFTSSGRIIHAPRRYPN